MTWQPEIEELKRRQAMAEAMGGPDKVKRQHDGGRLTVRERVLKLVDKDSFHEVGAIAGRGEYDAKGDLESLTPSNCVMGRAEIDGRPVWCWAMISPCAAAALTRPFAKSPSWRNAWPMNCACRSFA